MKKISSSIRIGMVRRGSIPLNPNADTQSSIISEQTNHQPPKQAWRSRLSVSAPNWKKRTITSAHEIPTKTKWSTTKKVVVGVVAAVVAAAVITVATVVPILLTRSADTIASTTGATTIGATTIPQNITTAYWSFGNNTADLYGIYNGQLIGSASFTPPFSSSMPYVGYGQALFLNATLTQAVNVPTFFDLTYTSFTIELWIYPMSIGGDRGIFGQCSCSICSNQCLYFILRSGRLYMGFTSNDVFGTTTLLINNWYHIAFVYNYQTQQQILYINGVQDGIKSNAQPYQGTNGSIHIGSTQVYSTTNYFQGYIDNLLLTTRAKSSDEILRDASLVAYYSFDLPNINLDNGPNGLNGTVGNAVTATGRVNQALRLSGAGSYFYANGFYNVPYGVTNTRPFSVSMWIYPTTSNSSTFVQIFPTSFSLTSCTNLLGIYSPASTVGQVFVMSYNNAPSLMTGPFISQNNWTHISLTYSSTNGYTLYINGNLFGSTGSLTYPTSGTFAYIFIGFLMNCNSASVNFPYQGSVDEVYVHSRELTQSDVTALANP